MPSLNCAIFQPLFCGGVVPTVQIGTLGAVGTLELEFSFGEQFY
jgi:hypothetical protein